MPKAHADLLAMGHGRNNRNTNCYNCHSQSKRNELATRDGTKLTFDQAPLLCASCHGPMEDASLPIPLRSRRTRTTAT